MSDFYIEVALDLPLPRLFSYRCCGVRPVIGSRVIVPFGARRLSGIVLAHPDSAGEYADRIKDVELIPNDMPPLPAEVIELCRFAANYYQHPLGEAISAALPTVFRSSAPFKPAAPEFAYVCANVPTLLASISTRAKAQRAVAEMLATPQMARALRERNASGLAWAKAWVEAGLVAVVPLEQSYPDPQVAPQLNAEQAGAVAAINAASGFAPHLLYGVTGSGKTEVYLQTIATVLARGGQVLVLVPEINLTPQLESRFRARFPQERIVCLNSSVTDTERARGWLAAGSGEAGIVLGTRLSVFTPMPRLELIIIDEEHDPSYKQQDGLRYSARDVAVYRANQRKIPIVLGSATPSIETWQNARAGRYQMLTLAERAVPGSELPQIQLLPMKRARAIEGMHSEAIAAIKAALARQEQVLVFINRRGFAPVLGCGECGWMASCHHCAVRMVVHLSERRLRCHHCGHETRIPPACPDCGNQDIKPLGQGTQRLEAALSDLFPEARILRIDRDSTRKKGELAAALDVVHAGEADILVGTQMLAKGHDFARLTCVVVLNADAGLFSVDFRAEERMFALLTQVAGRAGRRGDAGRVLIQTQFPEHPFYQALLQRDYAPFADRVLRERASLLLPPASAWAIVRAEAKTLEAAMDFLNAVQATFPLVSGLSVHEPVPAVLVRKAGLERAQLLVAASQRRILLGAFSQALPAIYALPARQVRWSIDVDPADV